MKKIVFVIITLVLLISVAIATADCTCEYPTTLRIVALKLVDLDFLTPEQTDAAAMMALGEHAACSCKPVKEVLWHMALEGKVQEHFTTAQIESIEAFMTHCNCCSDTKETKTTASSAVAKPKHTHSGGTHDNGGKCTSCGKTYQTHTITYDCDNTWHRTQCSCGWTGGTQSYHKKGTLIAKDGNLETWKCSICSYVFTWRVNTAHVCCEDCDCKTGK